MISAEAPIIFAKACEIFILELTLRAWIQTEENKRRTLQRSDVGAAISKNDTFDFLIDIVPRDENRSASTKKDDFSRDILGNSRYPVMAGANNANVMMNETMAAMNYYFPNNPATQAPAMSSGTAMDQQQLIMLQQQYQQQLQQQQQFQQYLMRQQQVLQPIQQNMMPMQQEGDSNDNEEQQQADDH